MRKFLSAMKNCTRGEAGQHRQRFKNLQELRISINLQWKNFRLSVIFLFLFPHPDSWVHCKIHKPTQLKHKLPTKLLNKRDRDGLLLKLQASLEQAPKCCVVLFFRIPGKEEESCNSTNLKQRKRKQPTFWCYVSKFKCRKLSFKNRSSL